MENTGKRNRRLVQSFSVCLTMCGKLLSAAFCFALLSSAAIAETAATSDSAVSSKWYKLISDRARDKGISKEDAAKEIISEFNAKKPGMECNATVDGKVKGEERSDEPDHQMHRLLWLLPIILCGAAGIADKKIKEFAKAWIGNGEKNEKLYKCGFAMIRIVLCGALVVGALICIYCQVIDTQKKIKRAAEAHERWEKLLGE